MGAVNWKTSAEVFDHMDRAALISTINWLEGQLFKYAGIKAEYPGPMGYPMREPEDDSHCYAGMDHE